MAFGWLFSAASEITSPVRSAVRALLATPADRRVWTTDNRTHVEIKGVHHPANARAAREIEQRLGRLDGVHRAEVNAVLGRVMLDFDPAVTGPGALAMEVSECERDYELHAHGTAPASANHPSNPGPLLREVGTFGAHAAGLSYALATALLPGSPIPPAIPAVASLIDSVPWMRSTMEHWIGSVATEVVLAGTGATAHTLAGHPLPLLTQSCRKLCTAREMIARQQAWRDWEARTAGQPGLHRSTPFETPPRPEPMPDGPVERVANLAGGLALAGYGTVLATTWDPNRALAALSASVPGAGGAGREAFAAQLGTVMSRRGDLVFSTDALRGLDRVDAVLLDAPILLTGRDRISTVTAIDPDADTTVLFERASELIDIRRSRVRNQRGRWETAPLKDFRAELPYSARTAASTAREHGGRAAVLLKDSRPVAVVGVEAELHPHAEAIVDAAHSGGSVIIAGVGHRLERRLRIDRVLPGGNQTLESVRRLQAEGHVVAVLSRRSHAALTCADLGIGLPGPGGALPWGADIICMHAAQAHTLLTAATRARQVSRRGAVLSTAGSACGVAVSLGPSIGASTRASTPVQIATLIALGIGTWSGMQAAHVPPPPVRGRTPWHALPASSVLGILGSSSDGLSETEARRRQLPAEQHTSERGITQAVLEGLINPMTAVLGAGAAISAGLGSVIDAGMILFALGASALVDGVQQVTTERALAQLLEAGELPARLRRAGVERTVPSASLVPGDIVEVRAGDGVPADCRILDAQGAELDESSLTGESQLVAKSARATGAPMIADRTSMLYQGTVLASGQASAVVVATGTRTELGSTALEQGNDIAQPDGVEARLNALAKRTLPLSAGAGGVLMVADLLRGYPPGRALSRAVGLAVAAVPEGLPFVATVAETAAARRLSDRGVLVRSPKTIEALGRVNALCFDKTGTLTQGRISLQKVSDGTGSRFVDDLDPTLRHVVSTAVRASPERSDRPLPHPTDRAVLDGAERAGVIGTGEAQVWQVLADLPFEPSRGFHAARTSGPSGERVHVKGAPEVVLERCSRWVRRSEYTAFDQTARATVDAEVEQLAQRGYRVLAVAERDATGREQLEESDVDELDFVGLLALADPVHPTAAEAVGTLRQAGVDVIMITGDHPSTAEAIAAELDMLRDRSVVNGAELDAMDDDRLAKELPRIAVFARVSPGQKARIVRQLRRSERVVAMTGDGANDVPAIKLAQVGIALGSRATPAAREAADLVITDDRIETITEAIIEGRGMWASVHDALSILLGGNLGEIAFTLGSGLLGARAAPNARQLLVTNLLTDVLPALAIAVRPPPEITAEQLLTEGPEASLGAALSRDVCLRATATAGAAGMAWLLARPLSTAGQARTTGLVALVAGQLGQTMAMRGRTPLVLVAGAGSLVILTTVVQVPGVSQFFGSQPLGPHQWIIALGSATAATAGVTIWQVWTRPHPG